MSSQATPLRKLASNTLNKVNQGKKRTHTIPVDFSDIDPEFIGKFIVHYPSQMERLAMGVLKSQLLEGNFQVDVMTDNIAHFISTLETVIDYKPDWFDIFSPDVEYEMMEEIYIEYAKWIDSFRKRATGDANTEASTNGGSEIPVVDTNNIQGTANGQ